MCDTAIMGKPALSKGKKALTKGKKQSGSSTDKKKKALSKGKAKPKAMKKVKATINKQKLKALGSLSLHERVKMATEEAETPEEAAATLKETLTAQEQQSAWGKMKTKLKNDPEEASKVAKMSKKEVGLYATLCLLQEKAPKFMAAKQELTSGTSLTKGETWESETQMLQKFTKDELQMHLASGRILWRADPWTPNCWQYQDQGDIKKVSTVAYNNNWAWGQEYSNGDEEQKHFSTDLSTHLMRLEGKGKGKAALTKGGGKGGKGGGKGKGKTPELLAIEDGDPGDDDPTDPPPEQTQEQLWNQCLTKARRARDQCMQAASNLEEEVKRASNTGRLSKASKKDAEVLIQEAEDYEKKFKDLLLKKQKWGSLTKAKNLIAEASSKCKELRDEKKEIGVIANKAYSRASTKK